MSAARRIPPADNVHGAGVWRVDRIACDNDHVQRQNQMLLADERRYPMAGRVDRYIERGKPSFYMIAGNPLVPF